jgi:hypothetical protein
LATLFCPQNIRVATRISTRGVRRGGGGGNLDRLSRSLSSIAVDAPSHGHECLGKRPWTYDLELDRRNTVPLTHEFGDLTQTCHLRPGKSTLSRCPQGICNPPRLSNTLKSLMTLRVCARTVPALSKGIGLRRSASPNREDLERGFSLSLRGSISKTQGEDRV